MMNNQGNPKLLFMENTVSSPISNKTSLSLVLSQEPQFKPSLFVKKKIYKTLKSVTENLLQKNVQTFDNTD